MRKLLVLAFIVALIATGCERKTVDFLNTPVISEARAYDAARKALDNARSRSNAFLYTRVRFEIEGKPVTIEGLGRTDFAHRRTELKQVYGKFWDLIGVRGFPSSFTYLFTTSPLYIKKPGSKDKWAKLDARTARFVAAQALGGGASLVDPGASFAPLRGIQKTVDFVGTDDLRLRTPSGTVATVRASEFHVRIDPSVALRRAPTRDQNTVRSVVLGFGELIPASVWVGADGLVYQMAFSITRNSATTAVLYSMFDFGDAHAVTLPKASKVTDVHDPSELGTVFGSGGGSSTTITGSSSPPPSPSPSASPSSSSSASPSPSPS